MHGLKNSIILLIIIMILAGSLLIYRANLRKSGIRLIIPEKSEITKIAVDSIVIEEKNNNWIITHSIHYLADKNYVEARIKKLKELKIGDYVVVDSSYYSDYGFEKNSKRAAIFFDNDSAKFLIGKSASVPDAFFLIKEGDKGIYTAYGFSSHFISSKISDWRDKEVLFIKKDEIDSLQIYKYKKLIYKGPKNDSIFNKSINEIYRIRVSAFLDSTKEKFPYKIIFFSEGKKYNLKCSEQISSFYILRNDSTIFKVYSHYMTNFLNIIQSK